MQISRNLQNNFLKNPKLSRHKTLLKSYSNQYKSKLRFKKKTKQFLTETKDYNSDYLPFCSIAWSLNVKGVFYSLN